MRVAINGFGRIGRAVFKIALEKNIDVVAINDLSDANVLAYLLKYDSVYGNYNKKISVKENKLVVGKKEVKVFSEPEPQKLPWKKLKIDVVVESTGFFTDRKGSEKHLKAGAKKVIITAPAKNPDITVVLGVNDEKLKKEHRIISMASCTTNCLAPLVKILDESFGIRKGFMSTVHAYTSTQALLDSPNKKLRRGRAASLNIVPSTTGATIATSETWPKIKGKVGGMAFRVPVACGSVVDFVAELDRKVTKEEVNNLFKKESKTRFKGILTCSEEELVSSDIIGNPHSSIVDLTSTQAIDNMVKVLSWYDNEYGYSCRVVDLIKKLRKFV